MSFCLIQLGQKTWKVEERWKKKGEKEKKFSKSKEFVDGRYISKDL
jgi:hypothetical protein